MSSLTIQPNLVILDHQSTERDEVLKQISLKLEENGYVKPTFYDALIAREEEYPTGLAGRYTNFAIPHTTSNHVNTSAIALAICKNSIGFRSMENPDHVLGCKVISVLAIEDSIKHLEVLRDLIKLMESEEFPALISKETDSEKIAMILNSKLRDIRAEE